jgi:hypothetical protein
MGWAQGDQIGQIFAQMCDCFLWAVFCTLGTEVAHIFVLLFPRYII